MVEHFLAQLIEKVKHSTQQALSLLTTIPTHAIILRQNMEYLMVFIWFSNFTILAPWPFPFPAMIVFFLVFSFPLLFFNVWMFHRCVFFLSVSFFPSCWALFFSRQFSFVFPNSNAFKLNDSQNINRGVDHYSIFRSIR